MQYLKEIVRQLKNVLLQQLAIFYGKSVFRQNKGIPQGLSVSGVLCSVYFSHLENQYLDFLDSKHNNLLMRLTDDYLFVSDSLENA